MSDELDLEREALRDLTEAFCHRAGNPSEPFGLYGFSADDPDSEIPRSVERRVFTETFGNTAEVLAEEYGPYEPATYFFAVIDHIRHLPVGSTRLILPSPAGSKTLNDVEQYWGIAPAEVLRQGEATIDPADLWDVATIAVDSHYRRAATMGIISASLYQAVVRNAARAGIGWTVTVLDLAVLEMIQEISHDSFSPFAGCEPMRYLDSPLSLPMYCDVPRQISRLAEVDPPTYELVVEGKGLEAAVRPPDWDAMTESLATRVSSG